MQVSKQAQHCSHSNSIIFTFTRVKIDGDGDGDSDDDDAPRGLISIIEIEFPRQFSTITHTIYYLAPLSQCSPTLEPAFTAP